MRRTARGLELELTGEWGVREVAALEAALDAVDVASAPVITLATAGISGLDLSGAWVLRAFVQRARRAGAEIAFAGPAPDQLRLVEQTLADPAAAPAEPGCAPAPRSRAGGR